MGDYKVERSATVSEGTEVRREMHRLGGADVSLWRFMWAGGGHSLDKWEGPTRGGLATRAEAVADAVAHLRQRAADMLALAAAMEVARDDADD